MTTKDKQARRYRIMNDAGQLPGDKARAEGEENEDFDSADSGNFSEITIEGSQTHPGVEQQVNESKAQLPGDKQRGGDDRRVDEGGHNRSADQKSTAKRDHAPSLSAQELGNELDDGTKTGGKTVDG